LFDYHKLKEIALQRLFFLFLLHQAPFPMKIIVLLPFLIFLNFSCYSQDKGCIGLAIGVSTPVGDYASKDVSNYFREEATQGWAFNVLFTYMPEKNFGICASLFFQEHRVDDKATEDQWNKRDPSYRYSLDADSWSQQGFVGGPKVVFNLFKELLYLEAKANIGFLRATSPRFTVSIQDLSYFGPGSSAKQIQESGSGIGFCYILGTGLKYNISNKWCFLLNADYLSSKVDIQNIPVSYSYQRSSTYSFEGDFQTINITLGIGRRF